MHIRVPKHIEELESYKPGKATDNVFEGYAVTRTAVLSSNENNLGVSPKAQQAIAQAAQSLFLYPDPSGKALRTKLAEQVGRRPEEIILGNGSDGLLSIIFKTFFEPGDILVSSHATFVAVNVMTRLNQIDYRQAPMKAGYAFDLEAIARMITPETKGVYLCNPNNPTGAMIPKAELEAFVAQVPDHILVIVDEAYAEFARELSTDYPDATTIQRPNLITLRTFSKAYGLAGLRLGFGVAHPDIIATLMKVKLTFEPSFISQAAGLAALDDDDFMRRTVENAKAGLLRYYEAFDRMGLSYVPSFGNFVMVDFDTTERAMAVFQALLERGVFVRPLRFFQLPHCLRITVGLPEECDLLIEKMEEVVRLGIA